MKAQDVLLCTFIDGSHILKIPIYQRYYSWTSRECGRLFDDIEKLASFTNKNHFLASIVRYFDSGKPHISEIIDGQQRLTTISLLILAIINNIKHNNIATNMKYNELTNSFIFHSDYTGKKSIKMNLIEKDDIFYKKIVNDEVSEDDENQSNLCRNYCYFYNKVKSLTKISLDEFWNAFERIKFVDILLEAEDDPQTIFESLNSTGMSLTEADKVKNLLLMKSKNKDELYKNYWEKIENKTSIKDVSKFIRFFLIVKQDGKKIVRESNVYESFKEWHNGNEQNTNEGTLKILYEYADYFSLIKNANTTHQGINDRLFDIKTLDIGVTYPFLMQIICDYINNTLSKEQVCEILDVIISYVFRNTLCGNNKNFNNIFSALYRDIKKEIKNDIKNFVPALIALLRKKHFPNNEQFQQQLLNKDISHHRKYLLLSVLNFNSKEKIVEDTLQVEHIIPQTLKPEQKQLLKSEIGSDKWERWYQENLHKLGNLTLTGYNSEMSNKNFSDKQDTFKQSNIIQNRELGNYSQFGKKEFDERFNKLLDIVVQVWKYPNTTFNLSDEKEISLDSIDNTDDYTGYKPVEIMYPYGNDLLTDKIDSWQECFDIMKKLASQVDVEILQNLVSEKRTPQAWKKTMACDVSDDLVTPMQIGSVYIERSLNSNDVIKYFARFCEKCDIDLSSITIIANRVVIDI